MSKARDMIDANDIPSKPNVLTALTAALTNVVLLAAVLMACENQAQPAQPPEVINSAIGGYEWPLELLTYG